MRKLTAAALTGVAGLAITTGAMMPALADDVTDDDATSESRTLTDRLTRLKEALAGLVSDGTISQAQADTVAETLDSSELFRGEPGMRGGPGMMPGGMGGGAELDAAAEALGLEEDALRDLLSEGSTLADVAEEQGVAASDLVDALVTAATEHIDAAVADGRLDEDRAEEMKADLETRIAEMVEEGLPMRGHGARGGPMGEELEGTDAAESSLES